MRLDQRKIHWIIRQKQKDVTTKPIALDMKKSQRRVQQIGKGYVDSGQEPAVSENMDRPRKLFDERESQVVGGAIFKIKRQELPGKRSLSQERGMD
jgi:hypothetical protein